MTVPSVAGVFNASGIDINVTCVFNIPLVYCNKGLIMAGVYEINEREGIFFVSLELINGQAVAAVQKVLLLFEMCC